MPRYKITVAYEGTSFHGWQKQCPPGQEPLRTVQGVLEEAVRQVVREPISLLGASRTDAGVHAVGQVAAFTTTREIPIERVPAAITSRLPEDIQVIDAAIVPGNFSPITDCDSKGYRYRFSYPPPGVPMRRARPPLFGRHVTTWTPYDLDVPTMHTAAQYLVGEHDFASLTRVNHGRENTVRTIHACSVVETSPGRCHIDVSGNGFLYNMVRIIAGTLLEVGRGAKEASEIPGIIEACSRDAAGPTLPPEGLFLHWIRYPGLDEATP